MTHDSSLVLSISTKHGNLLWAIARRYCTGVQSPEDIYQELLLRLHEAVTTGRLDVNNDPAIRSLVISKAIDINRFERRRRCGPILEGTEGAARIQPLVLDLEERDLREAVMNRMPHLEALALLELAFPCSDVIRNAREDQDAARHHAATSTALRMDVGELRVQMPHVRRYLSKVFEGTERLTTPRIRRIAQQALADLFPVRRARGPAHAPTG